MKLDEGSQKRTHPADVEGTLATEDVLGTVNLDDEPVRENISEGREVLDVRRRELGSQSGAGDGKERKEDRSHGRRDADGAVGGRKGVEGLRLYEER